MSIPRIIDFVFDEENEEKLAAHGLTPERVAQVLDGEYRIVPNRKRRRASHLIIGRDRGGACIAIPIERTHDPSLWRPVTAWLCKDSEWAKLC